MKIEELIKICKDRNEVDFLFLITKQIAESDSICEAYKYCNEYKKEQFNNAEKHIEPDEYKLRGFKDNYCQWLEYGGILVYKLYLEHIGVLSNEDF